MFQQRIRGWAAAALTAIGFAVATLGCGGDQPDQAGQGDEEIKIGVIMPLSGDLQPFGKGCITGVQLRVEQINAAGGVNGRKVQLVIEDNLSKKDQSRNAMKKLASADNVVAVIGPLTSTNAFAAKIDADQLNVPLICPVATNDLVTARTNWVFRTIFKDSFQGRVIANYCWKKGIRTAGVMIDANSDYAKGLSEVFTEVFQAKGGTVHTQRYQPKDPDFGGQLRELMQANVEVMFVPGYPPDLPNIIKQAGTLGFEGPLCGPDGWDRPEVIDGSGDKIIGCFLTSSFSPEDPSPSVQRFVQQCRDKTGREPGGFEAMGYETVSLLVEAMKGGVSRERIKNGLMSIKDFDTGISTVTITPEGDAVRAAVVFEIVRSGDGYAKKYVETVSP